MTIEELKNELKHGNNLEFEQLRRNVRENVQWAWENWPDIYLYSHFDDEKPEKAPDSFYDEWVDNEPFDMELNAINNPE